MAKTELEDLQVWNFITRGYRLMVFTDSRLSEHRVLGGSVGDIHEAVFLLKEQVSAGQAVVSHAGKSPCCPWNGLIVAALPSSNHLFFSLRILRLFISVFFPVESSNC